MSDIPIPKPPTFLSRIPDRNPKDKLHKTEAHAKAAFSPVYGYNRYGELYELVDNEWVLRYSIPDPRDYPMATQTFGNRAYKMYLETRPWKRSS